MLPKVSMVKVISPNEIQVAFDDGTEGKVSLVDIIGKGVFVPLKDEAFFKKVYINPESGAIAWTQELEIDPVNIYLQITGQTIEQLSKAQYA